MRIGSGILASNLAKSFDISPLIAPDLFRAYITYVRLTALSQESAAQRHFTQTTPDLCSLFGTSIKS
jgi:hypothetical protein